MGCQPGDCIMHMVTLIFIRGLCGYVSVNILTLSPQGLSLGSSTTENSLNGQLNKDDKYTCSLNISVGPTSAPLHLILPSLKMLIDISTVNNKKYQKGKAKMPGKRIRKTHSTTQQYKKQTTLRNSFFGNI